MTLLPLGIYMCIAALVVHVLLNLCTRQANRLPPGPASWPIVGNLPHIGPSTHQSLGALAKRYGPLMHLRLGLDDVVVAGSASVAAQLLRGHDMNFSNRPHKSAGKYIAYNYQDLVMTPYGPQWKMLRKVCSVHLFSTKALDNFRQVRQEEVVILTRTLVGAEQSAVKLNKLINVCTTNVLARVILGRRLFGDGSKGSDPEADEFMDMVVELTELAGKFFIGDFIPALDWLDLQGVAKKMKKIHSRFDSFLSTILQEYKTCAGGSGHVHFLSKLLSLKDDHVDGKAWELSDIQIKALLLDLFVAGTDTTSNTVEWAVAELIRNPQLLKLAKEEMDTVVGRDRLVTELDLTRLKFLQAIVKETFRLHPATPLSLPRIASESCEVNGYNIPKGSTLLVNVWAIARDPNMWTDPLEFRPARFLPGGEKPETDIKGNDFEVIPFGAGRRICVGLSLGLRMVQLVTATLIQAFDWELDNGVEPENLNMEEAHGLGLRMVAPLMVHPIPRLASHVYNSRN